jgi:hypothetical protein
LVSDELDKDSDENPQNLVEKEVPTEMKSQVETEVHLESRVIDPKLKER